VLLIVRFFEFMLDPSIFQFAIAVGKVQMSCYFQLCLINSCIF